ncbi:cytochrome c maturation protein CcmE [Neomegalonema perideroedes]|uniref:cytochrome c maturation protein CcmE n=1 Tax=Neomegalonema perideroedes TaxID=217219 RepID=UPI00035D0FA9|nr:cytochrome c maturation protein CcmE [Neomegalonema perideroedes]
MASRKKQRILMLVLGGVALTLSTVLVSLAMRDSLVFFFGPGELSAKAASGEITPDRRVRLGGLVEVGSVRRDASGARFVIEDGNGALPVVYEGILPDLFGEGQGAVAEGYLRDGVFRAASVLAKHDENYMPREVAEELKRTGRWREEDALSEGLPRASGS